MTTIRLGIISKIKGGKGTAEKYLRERYNAQSVRYSTPLREMLDCLHLAQTRENMQDISSYVRSRYGEEIIGAEIITRLNAIKSPYQVIDGIRRPADIVALLRDPLFRCVYVEASAETRYKRQIAAPENPGDAEMTFEEFMARDNAEAERDIETIGRQAHYRIVNEGIDKDQYHARLEGILLAMRARNPE